MRPAGQDTMHYFFVWKKWQWLVSLWMEVNLCLNTGGCSVEMGGLSGGRWRRQAVYWELDQWQVNPLWRKPFIFVKAFLLQIHQGQDEQLLMSQSTGRASPSDATLKFIRSGEILKVNKVCFWIYFPFPSFKQPSLFFPSLLLHYF